MSTVENTVGTPGRDQAASTATEELLARAGRFAARRRAAGITEALPARPATGVAVVTCMDARIDVEALFGLAEGDAHILRNAGGVVTEDMERSLAISQHVLGTSEILLVHHTGCGLAEITDEGFRRSVEARTGVRPNWSVHAFTDVADDVRRSIRLLRSSPFLCSTSVRGFVYDVATGELTEVTP